MMQVPLKTWGSKYSGTHGAMLPDWLNAMYARVGACERILKTSIPACYTRHTSREPHPKPQHISIW